MLASLPANLPHDGRSRTAGSILSSPWEGRTPDASQSSDEELVRRVRAGDEAAARLLFERHLPSLRAKARARLPTALRGKVAESDVIQEAWLAAYLALGKFEDRGDGSFGRWLRGILEHKVLEEVAPPSRRGQARRPTRGADCSPTRRARSRRRTSRRRSEVAMAGESAAELRARHRVAARGPRRPCCGSSTSRG